MQVVIGQAVRVKRGAEFRSAIAPTHVTGEVAKGNRETGAVRQVWRGDKLAQIELDRGARVVVRLRDLRATQKVA